MEILTHVLDMNPELKTIKNEKEEHGRGIPKIKSIVEKYGGMCDFYEEDGFKHVFGRNGIIVCDVLASGGIVGTAATFK